MSAITLDLITKGLIEMLELAAGEKAEESLRIYPNALPADNNGGALSGPFYSLQLFQVNENSYNKNAINPLNPGGSVRFTPLTLDLMYVLSAKTYNTGFPQPEAYEEVGTAVEDLYKIQEVFTYLLKTFHDYPSVNANNDTFYGMQLASWSFPANVTAHIALQTLDMHDAIQYWSASPLGPQLSAYYKVTVIPIQPEISTVPKRVLSFAVPIFVTEQPRITGTSNEITVKRSDDSNATQTLSPAQLTAPASGASKLSIQGEYFNNTTKLELKTTWWACPVGYTPNAVKLKPKSNRGTIEIDIKQTMNGTSTCDDEDGDMTISPGVYTVQAINTVTQEDSSGNPKTFDRRSNLGTFTVLPHLIDFVDIGGDPNLYELNGGYFIDTLAEPDPDWGNGLATEFYIDDFRMTQVGSGDALNAGQFKVSDASKITLNLPLNNATGVLKDDRHFLRVVVNGVPSTLLWITVTLPDPPPAP